MRNSRQTRLGLRRAPGCDIWVDMADKLPTTEGRALVFWDDCADDPPVRAALISNGDAAWDLQIQIQEDMGDGPEWVDGGCVTPGQLAQITLKLVALAVTHADRTAAQFADLMIKGKSEIPIRTPVTLMRAAGGLRVTLTAVADNQDGSPLLGIDFKRPLSGTELLVLCQRLAKASDWYAERMQS